jgi:cytochrome d ubiquinol oxidase subunit II
MIPIPELLDYDTLRIIWWLLLGILLIGLAIMDGFDFGVASLLPFVARNDIERRIVINTVGPVWEGNQVWLILGGGAIFAAWPSIYAVTFSGFYLAMVVILAAIILRPVGFKFRSKLENQLWRKFWDICIFIGGFIPGLIFGVAVGNVIIGIPFSFDDTLRISYTGTFWQLLNPFSLLCGAISIVMFMQHGAIYLALKTEENINARCKNFISFSFIFLTCFLLLAAYLVTTSINGYEFISSISPNGPSNPLLKQVQVNLGSWKRNYTEHSWMWLAPVMAFGGLFFTYVFSRLNYFGFSFISSSISIFGVVSIPGLMMFPFILPSSTFPNHSLTVYDASSSKLTLFIMLIASLIFVPIILAYTSWVYHVLRGKITSKTISDNQGGFY